MEPFEFDELIKKKLLQENELHTHEIEKAKPFVWTAVQQELNKTPFVIRWQYAAAAVILLLIGFSFLFFFTQQQHSREIQHISKTIELLEKNYTYQTATIQLKDQELNKLCKEVNQLETKVINTTDMKPTERISPSIVYLTDTVYIKQVERITMVSPEQDSSSMFKELVSKPQVPPSNEAVAVETSPPKVYDNIYPRYASTQQQRKQNELIKIKFSSFSQN